MLPLAPIEQFQVNGRQWCNDMVASYSQMPEKESNVLARRRAAIRCGRMQKPLKGCLKMELLFPPMSIIV